MALTSGQILNNRYRIQGVIKQGTRSVVYFAWDSNLDAKVVIKEIISSTPEVDQSIKIEARQLATVRHSNLPYVIDHFSIAGGGHYLVTEFIDGRDLQTKVDQVGGPLPLAQIQIWIREIGEALAFLHLQIPPIYHRDVKPGNILINSRGQAMLVGFSIGRATDPSQIATIATASKSAAYIAPELHVGTVDARSDLYSLGATLYTLLTGRPPVNSLKRQAGQILVPPRQLNPTLTPQLEGVVLRALEMDPNQRYQNVEEMLGTLRASALEAQPAVRTKAIYSSGGTILEAEPPHKRDSKWVVALIAGSLLLCLLIAGVGGLGVYTYFLIPGSTEVPQQTTSLSPTNPPLNTTVVELPLPLPPTEIGPSLTLTLAPGPTILSVTSAPSEQTVTASATVTALNPTWVPCVGVYPSRLRTGDTAFVSYDPPLSNRVRSQPNGSSKVLGYIQPGEKVEIIDGPVCSNQWIWWQVRSLRTGLTGWTAEGNQQGYWLVPVQ